MTRLIHVFPEKQQATVHLGNYLIDWCLEHPGWGIGGCTGRSPVGVWSYVMEKLEHATREVREAVLGQPVVMLDEYLSSAIYYSWVFRHLRIGRGGFPAQNVYVPRGCFYEGTQLVSSSRLEEILADFPDDWDALTEPGEDGQPPEIRIRPGAEHPVLVEIREALSCYDDVVRTHAQRCQLAGVGVGGAISNDPLSGGHIGFVESGAASRDSDTMLVRLSPSTLEANTSDFALDNADGDASMEPSTFALTQGIASLLDFTSEMVVMAWGGGKRAAVERLLLGEPGPKNPAAWLQKHDNVQMYVDEAAFGKLDHVALDQRGWEVHDHVASAARR